jgi:uncharacterized protein YndB with AHSA1/START domain
MDLKEQNFLTAETVVKAPIDQIWNYWNEPEHITRWNSFSNDWYTSSAQNDLKEGGRFLYIMV